MNGEGKIILRVTLMKGIVLMKLIKGSVFRVIGRRWGTRKFHAHRKVN